jgi:hypothetical protein
MAITLVEGALSFEIDAKHAIQWDDSAAFRAGVQRLQKTRAVDIVADVNGVGAVYLEVKDFRAARTENEKRKSRDLALEVAEKVRDTLAGMTWACRRGLGEASHERVVGAMTRDVPLVVLWLEEDRGDLGGAVALATQIKAHLKPWLKANVQVASRRLCEQKPLAWLEVSSRPAPRLAKRRR